MAHYTESLKMSGRKSCFELFSAANDILIIFLYPLIGPEASK